ncbi:hypothetical protein OFC13_28145, partial [Escherichia coli]|nr:hypothetical protein [Escherichia coli]
VILVGICIFIVVFLIGILVITSFLEDSKELFKLIICLVLYLYFLVDISSSLLLLIFNEVLELILLINAEAYIERFINYFIKYYR